MKDYRPRRVRRPDLGEWANSAACREPLAPNMFPETPAAEKRVTEFCRRFCPVIEECGEYGLSQGFDQAGVYVLRRRKRSA